MAGKTTTKKTEDKINAPETKSVKKKKKLTDDVLINVKSMVFGALIYINHKTGDKTEWVRFGDIQQVSMADLRAMKQGQVKFYVDNWIFPISVYTEGYEDVTSEDILEELIVSRYYKNIISPDNFGEVCGWDEETIRKNIPLLNASAKENLIVALNSYISGGQLDSIKRIKAFEKALNCTLKDLEY